MITNFNKYSNINEGVSLTKDEQTFLWKKIEHKKKKKATEDENELYDLLNGERTELSSSEFNIILKSLEYSFRKKLSGQDKPMKLEVFTKLQDKIPSDWFGVSYSSLEARKKKLERDKEKEEKSDN